MERAEITRKVLCILKQKTHDLYLLYIEGCEDELESVSLYYDLELDEYDVEELIMQIEDEFGLKLPALYKEARVDRVYEIVNCIHSVINE